jgi:hypothetical protein
MFNSDEVADQRRPVLPRPEPTEWEKRARKALDHWEPDGLEGSVAEALETAFRDGINAAKPLDPL